LISIGFQAFENSKDLGLDEFFETSIAVVEWGDKVASEFNNFLRIAFDVAGKDEDHRQLTLSHHGQRWTEGLLRLKAEIGEVADVVDSCD